MLPKNRMFLRFSLALLCFFVFLSCYDPFSLNGNDGFGTFSITIGSTNPRASWLGGLSPEDLVHQIKIIHNDGRIVHDTVIVPGETATFSVFPDTYRFEVEAYDGSLLKAIGFAVKEITSGRNDPVVIMMGLGSGTEEDPFLVINADTLSIIGHPSQQGSFFEDWNLGAHYRQMTDIDLHTVSWKAIGNRETPFYGSYDGNGFLIDQLSIFDFDSDDIGFFGYIDGGRVSNLGIVNAFIMGLNNLGGIAGTITNGTTIENCFVGDDGTMQSQIRGMDNVGGVVGRSEGSTVINCLSEVDVFASTGNTGGIAGYVFDGSLIQNCFALGGVQGFDAIGGIVGNVRESEVLNCVALNKKITSESGSNIGRVFGQDDEGTYNNNYGRIHMDMSVSSRDTFGDTETGKHETVFYVDPAEKEDAPDSKFGKTITEDEWESASWWKDTALFGAPAWDLNQDGLPKLISGGNRQTLQVSEFILRRLGNVQIFSGDFEVGSVLRAMYTGSENVSFQWYQDGIAVASGHEFTANKIGAYYVVASYTDIYEPRTSEQIFIMDKGLPFLPGTVTIRHDNYISDTATITGTLLTAEYHELPGVTYRYHWNRDNHSIPGETSQSYIPMEPGKYSVTIGADGYNSITSEVVSVYSLLGTGTSQDPFVVYNAETLERVGKETHTGGFSLDSYYMQVADIDLSGRSDWIPIGVSKDNAFTGTYDGGGFTIDNLTINDANDYVTGMFAVLNINGTVRNLNLTNVNITASRNVGSIAGDMYGYSSIENCHVTGTINAANRDSSFRSLAGGIVGWMYDSGFVSNCLAMVNIHAAGNTNGGIAGFVSGGMVFFNVALNERITSSYNSELIGRIAGGSDGILINNYARADMDLRYNTYNDGTGGTTPNPLLTGDNQRDGESADAGLYNTQEFWQNTMMFDFVSVWEWDFDSRLPKLRKNR
ncbi:MAG: hypothetical protein FWC01_05355 [Treponema sp.]|nr:hypothetical protein [Treponema sp.]MCL2237293.1 hypothetical protein [Treponema sp.]